MTSEQIPTAGTHNIEAIWRKKNAEEALKCNKKKSVVFVQCSITIVYIYHWVI